jgi:hypothetical protein
MFPEEEQDQYRQRNIYTFPNGREISLQFEFRMQHNGRLKYETPLVSGEVWEEPLVGDYPTIRLMWRRSSHAGEFERDLLNARVHGLIQELPDQPHRARGWQWFVDDELVQRTLITEARVSTNWRAQIIDR